MACGEDLWWGLPHLSTVAIANATDQKLELLLVGSGRHLDNKVDKIRDWFAKL